MQTNPVTGDFLYMYLQQVLKLICIEMLTLDSPPIFIHTSPDINPPPFNFFFKLKRVYYMIQKISTYPLIS